MIKQEVKTFSDAFKIYKDLCPILVCNDHDKVNAMMINWGGFGTLWHKNVCFIFVRKDRYTFNFSEKGKIFTLSFLDLDSKISDIFGKKSGKDIDKFKTSGLHKCYDVDNDCYSIAEAKQVLKLKKLCSIDLENADYNDLSIPNEIYKDIPYHVLYICEVKQYLVREENE